MAEQYISLRVIHDRVTKHPLLTSITFDDVIRYAVDFMRIVGMPDIFINKTVVEKADKGRVKLPCDYIELIQMRGKSGVYRYTSDSFHMSKHDKVTHNKHQDCEHHDDNHRLKVIETTKELRTDQYGHKIEWGDMTHTENSIKCSTMPYFHPDIHGPKENTFMIQNGFIYLSNYHDLVEISYRAIMTDEEGIPMIPDRSKFERALVAYIKAEYFQVLFDLGSINQQVLDRALQDYSWAVGACETDLLKLDLSKAESLFNSVNSMVNHNNQFQHGFRYNNVKTELKGV